MFKFLKKRWQKPSLVHGVLHKMSVAAEQRQRKAANYLNGKVSVFSRRQLKVGLFVFCLLMAGGCSYVIWSAFQESATVVHIHPIRIPEHVTPRHDEQPAISLLSEQELKEIEVFEKWLDSLQQTRSGQLTYDSIASYRPGLLDSLAFIRGLYHEQLKSE